MLIVVFNLSVVRHLWGFVKARDPGWVCPFCGLLLTLSGIRPLYGLAWVRPWLSPSTLWTSVDPWWGPSTLWTWISLTLVGSVHFVDWSWPLVGSVHFVDLYKFVTLVRSVHFVDLYKLDPDWVRPFCGLVLTLGGVRPLCGFVQVCDPSWVRPFCGQRSCSSNDTA